MKMIRLQVVLFVCGFIFCLEGRATTLPAGQVTMGSITAPTQFDSYTFTGNPGDVANFTLVSTSGSLIPAIKVYNPAERS
jgi:hypothetical protein